MFHKLKRCIALYMGKFSIIILNIFKRSGTALPGKIAITIDKDFLTNINESCDRIILVTGTNGKTTTNNLLYHILKDDNIVLSNTRGANMIQGVATTYVRFTKDYYDYGVFEVDEGSLDRITRYLKPDYILVTNFFRDQLDRYGEIESIVDEVYEDIKLLPDTKLVINADDPYVNKLRTLNNDITTFGLNIAPNDIIETNLLINKCPLCGNTLNYTKHTYGHLGDYTCTACDFNNRQKDYTITNIVEDDSSQQVSIEHNKSTQQLKFPYNGLYNTYNLCGVYTLCMLLGLDAKQTIEKIGKFSFSLGRMEQFKYKDKTVKVILTKNPIGLSQTTRIISQNAQKKNIVHILNDNPADGRDISWIWDANTQYINDETINKYYCSGIRAEDMALKKKYDSVDTQKIVIDDKMESAINKALADEVEVIYVLPTYTAIFNTRDYIEQIVKKVN